MDDALLEALWERLGEGSTPRLQCLASLTRFRYTRTWSWGSTTRSVRLPDEVVTCKMSWNEAGEETEVYLYRMTDGYWCSPTARVSGSRVS